MPTAGNREFSPETRALLAGARDYRGFLRAYFEVTGLSYAEVARRAGFSSRSYPRDVTEGRRRLTVRSLPSLVRGLRIDPVLARLLQTLYFTEHLDEHPEMLSADALRARLARDRRDAARNPRGTARKKAAVPELPKVGDRDLAHLAAGLTDVFAALGELKEGATLDEIQRRTGLGRTLLARQLEALVSEGLVSYSGDSRRYFPGTSHLDWTGQAGSRLARSLYRGTVDRLAEAARDHYARPDALFISSAISVAREDLPRLKEELRDVLLKFVDRSAEASPSPDSVVQIVTGMFEGRLAPPRVF